jgi:Domain of unknown function DUF29
MNKTLYEQDFVLWSTEQGRAIRKAASARLNTPAPIDWENVAEEIETLGRSERSALRSHLLVIAEHLISLRRHRRKHPARIGQRPWKLSAARLRRS